MAETQANITLAIEGRPCPAQPAVPEEFAGLLHAPRIEAFEIFAPTRAAGEVAVEATLRPGDVMELELEGGFHLWMTVEEYRRDFAPAALRGDATLRVPATLPAPARERGVLKWVLTGLRLFGFDPVEGAALKIAGKIDAKKGMNGLYACSLAAEKPILTPALPLSAGEAPLLILIHGTMSSTEGSFGGLWSDQGEVRRRLAGHYGERVYAFEHKTFTENPIDNALVLAERLPAGATLHLVSHSRGGMIGELICRAGRLPPDLPFDDDDFRLFSGSPLGDKLRRLGTLLREKKLRIERFVRVACPARGTTLASRRLDRCLSLLFSGLSCLDRSGWVGDIGWLVASIVKERTDPETMPGIEAMMPESSTVQLLNRPGVTVAADLRAMAGDYDGDGFLGWLGDWATEGFFGSETDVVVNTPSMYGGACRQDGGWFAYLRGPQVWHFSYFKQTPSAALLADGLLRDRAVDAGFAPLATAPDKDEEIARGILFDLAGEKKGQKLVAATPSPNGVRPLAVVVPGIMGTHLQVAGKRIWLDFDAVHGGEFPRLGSERSGVETDGIVRMAYADFVDFLAASHEVLVFPYDWRLSLRDEGARFAVFMATVVAAAEYNGRPVRIVAHSMGGLLTRMAAVLNADEGGNDWWPRLKKLRGSRLIMAGTPNGGSWVVPCVLTGRDAVIKNLALLDASHGRNELLRIVCRFEGFLEMLPAADNCFNPDTWASWRKAGEGWPLPDPALLAKCAVNRKLLERFDFHAEAAHVCYLAGHDDSTPLGVDASAAKLRFTASGRGDGRVLWATGIPDPTSGIKVWYLPAAHGDLLNHRKSFAGIHEVVDTGATTLLRQEPPAARAIDGAELPEAPLPYYPDAALLTRSALGMRLGRRELAALPTSTAPLRVTVCHGDLGAARHPVAVGHYIGDTINGAEAALDSRLGGALQRRHRLGIYPGGEESSDVFFADGTDWGAIIVGLGQVGDLTAAKLTRFFARALLRYVTVRPARPGSGEKTFKISATLIGSGSGWGLGIRDSVRALIDGARRANELLAAVDGARIAELELLELYEDRAIQALQAVRELAALGHTGAVEVVPSLRAGIGGRCRAAGESPDGWWQRVKIEATPEGDLKYSTISGLARVEERVQASQRELVDSFVDRAISSSRISAAEMVAIYNLVTPNALKESAADRGDLLLLLNPEAAGYPWEMMHVGDAHERQPLALRAGLIRQLTIGDYRERQRYSTGLHALVIADPDLPQNRFFDRLPGAYDEGKAVICALEKGMQVNDCVGKSSRDIVPALFEREYRILHLAGHGVYRWGGAATPSGTAPPPKPRTGMVIDWQEKEDQPLLLTEVEIEQMTCVPELVFINCCHLGLHPKGNELTGQNRFAGDLATAFIKMGVRAVVAAGWAVDDSAAEAFATTFYDRLLAGCTFGDAVRAARLAAKEKGGDNNTWAAYQCYGDPGYRLYGSGRQQKAKVYLAPQEAICDIRAIAGQLKDDWKGTPIDTASLSDELQRISMSIPHAWFNRYGALRAAFGEAYGAHGSFDLAIEHYEAASRCTDGQCNLAALEQLFNLRVRRTAMIEAKSDPQNRLKVATIEEYVRNFESLVAQIGASKDRRCLLGGAYKRIAHIWQKVKEEEKAKEALGKMVESYRHGLAIDPTDPYPAVHWAGGRIMQSFAGEQIDEEALKTVIRQARARAIEMFADNPRFWEGVHIADADLLLLMLELHNLKPAEINTCADAIGARYKEQIDERGTENGKDSIRFQLIFYLCFAENGVARMVKRVQKAAGLG